MSQKRLANIIGLRGLFSNARHCGAAVYRTAATANIPNAALTALLFTDEEEDTDAFHDTSSNTSRLVIPVTGFYIATVTVGWDSNAAGNRGLFIIKNGTDSATNRIAGEYRGGLAGSDSQSVTAAGVLSRGDFIEAYVFQTSTANRTIDPASGMRPRFSIALTQVPS